MRLSIITMAIFALLSCSTADHANDRAIHQPPAENAVHYTAAQVQGWLTTNSAGTVIIDVRDADEFATGHLPGARNIPADKIDGAMEELQQYNHVVLICNRGGRSSRAAAACEEFGIRNAGYLKLEDWKAAGLPVE